MWAPVSSSKDGTKDHELPACPHITEISTERALEEGAEWDFELERGVGCFRSEKCMKEAGTCS